MIRLSTLLPLLLATAVWPGPALAGEGAGAGIDAWRTEVADGREMLVHLPASLPPPGQRSLLVALHGGGGNARFMREHLAIDALAERHGFIVAYLNGSAAGRIGGGRMKAWNAGGGCCGRPAAEQVDDIGYVSGAVQQLQHEHGVAPGRSVAVGHSNGAMMVQALACQTGLFTRVVSLAGTLMSDAAACPAAAGHTIVNIHGDRDQNVPLAGGVGPRGISRVAFRSQAEAKARFEAAGGRYVLQVLPGAGHSIDALNESSLRNDGIPLAERLVRELGLAPAPAPAPAPVPARREAGA